jgi:hypothetical protein
LPNFRPIGFGLLWTVTWKWLKHFWGYYIQRLSLCIMVCLHEPWFSVSDATATSNTAQKIGFFLSFVRCQMRLLHPTLKIIFM